MNSFEQRIGEIDKDTKFRYYTKDLISRHSDKKHSILPYEIDVKDVYSILKDLNINENEKYVVFFNFEFVVVLKKLGISLNNIIFISGERKFYGFIRNNFGKFGLKTILFDTKQYQKYKSRKKWKKYIMKKIGKLDEYVVVGNIPFTINETDSDNSIKIGNDFVKMIQSSTNKYCYILRWKADSKHFINDIILNKNLQKIVFHKKSIFDIHANINTCHIVGNEKETDKFVFTDNISDDVIELNKVENVVLSTNVMESYEKDTTKLTLGDFWTRGKKYLKDIDLEYNGGRYKVIYSLGDWKTESFNYTTDDIESSTIGKWKILFPLNGGGKAMKLAGPEYSVIYNVVSLVFETEEQCKKVFKWCKEINLPELLNKLRTSGQNNKVLFDKISIPNEII